MYAIVGNGPEGIAFDSHGNLFVANYHSNTVSKIYIAANGSVNAVDNAYIEFSYSLATPRRLACDAHDNLFVSVEHTYDQSFGVIFEYNSDGALVSNNFGNFGSGMSPDGVAHPDGISVDGAGTVYFFDRTFGLVRSVSRTAYSAAFRWRRVLTQMLVDCGTMPSRTVFTSRTRSTAPCKRSTSPVVW
jgi:DNA-binding beta-propeller fold protein YncE